MTEYRLAKAIVEELKYYESSNDQQGNYFAVRIIPDMQDIKEGEEYLPKFPNFFQDSQQTYARGDVVWVLCVEDFTVGYVLGLVESSTGSDMVTIALNLIQETQRAVEIPEADISNFSDIHFSIKRNGAIEFVDSVTKTAGTIYDDKMVVLYDRDGTMHIRNRKMKVKFTSEGDMYAAGKLNQIKAEESQVDSSKGYDTHDSYKMETTGSMTFESGGVYQVTSSGDTSDYTFGNREEFTTKLKKETIGQGEVRKIVSEGSETKVLSGSYEVETFTDKVKIKTQAGYLEISATGAVKLHGALSVAITSDVSISIGAPFIKMPPGMPIMMNGGPGPFCGLPVCILTGIPHTAATYMSSGKVP